ncbi:MAG: amidophosphoribosyltransferase, partial [Thaumarchaeota archaeon]|nr:amidophosphoribosyltransferase [Nitrososphaerota archaeon]
MKEKCGVLAAYSLSGYDVAPMLVRGLEALQHRGQESWGIRVRGHKTFRRMGLAVEGLSGRVLDWKGQSG